ncbi:MAG: hypothetical protein HYZ52_04360 [Candidatus Omnitrophica bacterium]|nr:hypothetical protein [Candidatus Omnitrophota bacterium]
MPRFRKFLLCFVLILSIAFGFIRQIKIACRSVQALVSRHEAVDSRYRILKDKILSFVSSSPFDFSRFSYVSGIPGKAAERYYDFQYAMAPHLISDNNAHADHFVLDFETPESLESHCRDNSLEVLFQSGGLAIARKDRRFT